MTGTQIQTVALAWHVYILTDSPLQIGLIGLSRLIPFTVMSLVGGVTADRLDRRLILLVTQTLLMLLTASLVLTTVTGNTTPLVIYGVTFISGLVSSFTNPAQRALIPNLVPRSELANAFTLNILLRQVGTVIGPGIGGLLIAQFGLAATYSLNAASFLAVLGALLLMGSVPMRLAQSERARDMVLGGLHFVRGQPLIVSMLGLDLCVETLGGTRALLPIFARDILEVGPEGLGILQAAPGLGAILGGLMLGARGAARRPILQILVATVAQGLCLIGFGLSPFFVLSLLMMFGMGVTDVVSEVPRQTIIQLMTPDELRGRVTALNSIIFGGGPSLGQLESGAVASLVGAVSAAVIGGSLVVTAAARFALLPSMRRGVPEAQTPNDVASNVIKTQPQV